MRPYPSTEDLLRPVPRVQMPRAPRMVVPGSTVHVVSRCNNRIKGVRYLFGTFSRDYLHNTHTQLGVCRFPAVRPGEPLTSNWTTE
jgi:hypothetical protein